VIGRPRIGVTRRLPAVIEEALSARYDCVLNPTDATWSAETFRAAFQEFDAIVCSVADRIGAEAFPDAPARTRLLANFGVGTDHIALAGARAAGIVVTNTPGVLTVDTADLTIALMLATVRRLGEGERELRAGAWAGWRPTHLLGRRLSGMTLGIMGYGRIGEAVAQRAHFGFGMPIRYYTARPLTAERTPLGTPAPSLQALFAESDIVSIHCPSTPETRGVINADLLAGARPGLFIVNTARGDIIDDDALVAAIDAGVIAGAGLDVHTREPEVASALLALPQVVLLPHLGSATLESRVAMGTRVLANLEAHVAGSPLPDRVA
jgi:lactate dehydrogenase-like 2-hydroxyacid dehydrogenase